LFSFFLGIFYLDGLKDQRLNWVHVTDLADAYVRAAKRSHIVAGEDFNIVSESSPTYEEALRAAVAVAGFKGMSSHSMSSLPPTI